MKYITATVVAMVLFFGINKAEAGVIFYNTGEDIVEVSDIKEEARAEIEAEFEPGVKVGLVYDRFGLFWMDIWRWNARWAIVTGDAYIEVPKEELEEIAAGSLSKPITMTLPPGLIILLLGGIGFGIFAFVTRNDEDDENIYEDGIAQEQPGQDPQQYAQQPQQPGQPQQQSQQPGQPQQQYQHPGQAPQQAQYPPQPGQPGYDPNNQG